MMRTVMGLGLAWLVVGCGSSQEEQRGEKKRQAMAVPVEVMLFAPIEADQEAPWQELRAELEAPMTDAACSGVLLLPQVVVRRHDGVEAPGTPRRPPAAEQYEALINTYGSRGMKMIDNVPAAEILRKQELARMTRRPLEAWLQLPSRGAPRAVSELATAYKVAPYAMGLRQPLEPSVPLPDGTQRPESGAELARAVARQACQGVLEKKTPVVWIVVNPPASVAPTSAIPVLAPREMREPVASRPANVPVDRLPIVGSVSTPAPAVTVRTPRSKGAPAEPKRDVPGERVIQAEPAHPCQGGVLDQACAQAPEFRQVVHAREAREAPFTRQPAVLTRHELRR